VILFTGFIFVAPKVAPRIKIYSRGFASDSNPLGNCQGETEKKHCFFRPPKSRIFWLVFIAKQGCVARKKKAVALPLEQARGFILCT